MADVQAKPRQGRKLPQVLDGARRIFLRDGFDGASVDDIAREAGVSKATLYSYFPDKRLLFAEVARQECQRQADEAVARIDTTAPVETVLRQIGMRIAAFVSSDFGSSVFRICSAEAERFPEVGAEFYRWGPALVRDRIAEYLQAATAKGAFSITDFDLAAMQFAELCKVDLLHHRLFALPGRITAEHHDRVVEGAVAMFMARYGVMGRG